MTFDSPGGLALYGRFIQTDSGNLTASGRYVEVRNNGGTALPIFMKDHLPLIRRPWCTSPMEAMIFSKAPYSPESGCSFSMSMLRSKNLLNFNELAAINASDVRIQGGGQILQADRVDIEGSTIRFESAAPVTIDQLNTWNSLISLDSDLTLTGQSSTVQSTITSTSHALVTNEGSLTIKATVILQDTDFENAADATVIQSSVGVGYSRLGSAGTVTVTNSGDWTFDIEENRTGEISPNSGQLTFINQADLTFDSPGGLALYGRFIQTDSGNLTASGRYVEVRNNGGTALPNLYEGSLTFDPQTMVYLSYGSHDFQQGTILTGKRMQLFNVNATFENLLNFNELAAINASDVRIQGGGQILQADRVDIEGSTIRFESAAPVTIDQLNTWNSLISLDSDLTLTGQSSTVQSTITSTSHALVTKKAR